MKTEGKVILDPNHVSFCVEKETKIYSFLTNPIELLSIPSPTRDLVTEAEALLTLSIQLPCQKKAHVLY